VRTRDGSAREPSADLGAFSSSGTVPTPWAQARATLRDAPLYWLSTVRSDGRPHVTPVLGIWLGSAAYFCTGPTERKTRNLTGNRHCVLTTGCNRLDGLDVVLEGTAAPVDDHSERWAVAGAYESKYGAHLTAPGGTWAGLGNTIRDGATLAYRIEPTTAFGFGKGASYSQTRWQFDRIRTPDA